MRLAWSEQRIRRELEAQQWGTATWLVPFTPAGQDVKLLELRVAPPDPGYTDRLLLAAVRHPLLSLSGVLPLVAATALLLGLWVTYTLMLLTGLLIIAVLLPALARQRSCPAERLPADANFALRRLRVALDGQRVEGELPVRQGRLLFA